MLQLLDYVGYPSSPSRGLILAVDTPSPFRVRLRRFMYTLVPFLALVSYSHRSPSH